MPLSVWQEKDVNRVKRMHFFLKTGESFCDDYWQVNWLAIFGLELAGYIILLEAS